MEQLIKISKENIGDESVNTISAKELHKKLEVKRDFSTWIKDRISKYRFEENVDFMVISLIHQNDKLKTKGGDRKSKNYILTTSVAINIVRQMKNNPLASKIYKFLVNLNGKEVIIKEQKRKEYQFKTSLFKFLKPYKTEIKTQFIIEGYRVDFYLPEYNLVIEFDEEFHQYQKIEDEIRENKIKDKLNCSFIRIDEHGDIFEQLGLISLFISNNISFSAKKVKNSKQKRQMKILSLLKNKMLTAKQLSEKLEVSKTTIYKDLKFLLEENKILKIKTEYKLKS
jgi:anti-repressor protein